jgi:hypothetical protein
MLYYVYEKKLFSFSVSILQYGQPLRFCEVFLNFIPLKVSWQSAEVHT